MSAQLFPADSDGIVAGMPANNWTRLMAGDFDATLAVFTDAASQLTPSALSVLYRGALTACDASDGVTDGVVGDPNWDWRTFAFTDPADYEAHAKAEAMFAPILNATDPNLRAFQKRGVNCFNYDGAVRSADLGAEQLPTATRACSPSSAVTAIESRRRARSSASTGC